MEISLNVRDYYSICEDTMFGIYIQTKEWEVPDYHPVLYITVDQEALQDIEIALGKLGWSDKQISDNIDYGWDGVIHLEDIEAFLNKKLSYEELRKLDTYAIFDDMVKDGWDELGLTTLLNKINSK